MDAVYLSEKLFCSVMNPGCVLILQRFGLQALESSGGNVCLTVDGARLHLVFKNMWSL